MDLQVWRELLACLGAVAIYNAGDEFRNGLRESLSAVQANKSIGS
jgi:hypothetical protein